MSTIHKRPKPTKAGYVTGADRYPTAYKSTTKQITIKMGQGVVRSKKHYKTRCSVYIAASVDGFIATHDGGIEWLERPEYTSVPMKGLSYDEFIHSIDALVMGRNTFEKVLSFGSWPYEGTPVVVLSGAALSIPEHLKGKVRQESGEPQAIVERLAKVDMFHLYIDGGVTIQRFLEAKLINELTITRIPILLGKGLPLFGSTAPEQKLKLLDAVASDNGFVQERYEVETEA